MSSISHIHINSEKHSGAVDVHQHPTSKDIASFAAGTGFSKVKTLAVGEGNHPREAKGHVVIKPQLFPQVACHAIFHDDKTQISNKTPFGEVHIVFNKGEHSFTIENQHEGDLHVKFTPPAKSSHADDKAYLGSFNGAETLKTGDVGKYGADGHYAIRSTLDSNPANVFAVDFINNKIHMTNGNPAGEIAIALQKA
ncbi:hypothetical protein AAF712_008161 [Marasmius tenuissimus]|uniref:Uncharacterized protein n=1 Tax=Marasmius tenuissimus TaxID=585030 RepID=A0ABR2ZUX0_9AGAR|nr:hypothetical protein PM082_019859 [Marasmius tenuissimus]